MPTGTRRSTGAISLCVMATPNSRVGRQRIAWGTAHFWSPTDVFNPISPLQIEADERQGVDAAQLSLRLPQNFRWSLVYAPQDGFQPLHRSHADCPDHSQLRCCGDGGRFRQDWMAGANFAGQWGGAGLRGELTYTWRGAGSSSQANALRWTFGSDYAINNKWYVLGEYFYNQGSRRVLRRPTLRPFAPAPLHATRFSPCTATSSRRGPAIPSRRY